MKKLLVIFILIAVCTGSNAQQLSLAYYPLNNTLSITSNPERLLLVDARFETNTFFGNMNPEVFGMINIKRSNLFNIYSGLSCKTIIIDGFTDGNFIGGYAFSFGTRYKPFEKYHNIHFLFELSPYFNKKFKSGIFRAYLGISYTFKKPKETKQ